MIDTDKYEGHTPMWYLEGTIGVWRIESDFTTHDAPEIAILWTRNEADAQLLADAPDLLIEVKRLRERLDWILGDEELAGYVWEKEVAYMEHEGVRLPWISADEWGEEE